MNRRSNSTAGITITSLAALFYATLPIFTKLAYDAGSNAETFNFYKSAWAIPILAVILAARKKSVRLPGKLTLWAIVAGILCKGITSLLLFYSYNYVTSGVATTLHFMYPLFAALLARIFFRTRLPAYKWLTILAATLSVALLIDLGDGLVGIQGIVYAVLSAVVYAAYIMVVDKTGLSKVDPMVFSLYLAISGAVFALIFGLCTGSMALAIPAKAHAFTALAAIATSIIGVACFQQGIQRLGGASAAFFSLLEPAGSCVLGVIFLNEALGMRSLAGILLILCAVLAMVYLDYRVQQVHMRSPHAD